MSLKQKLSTGYLLNDRYRIVRCIGAGAVGQVYHARDLHLDEQDIALKLLHPHLVSEKKVLKRFHNEVFVSRKLIHPNIVRVYDLERWEAGHLLSLEYVPGCDLAEIVRAYASHKLPYEEALYIVLQVAEGIACAHKNDVVHRDLKPHNILLDRQGVARVTDFGLAFSLETSHAMTQTGEVLGSPSYLAPEQFARSRASKRADIYSFGIILFELIVGELPFRSASYYGLGEAHRVAPFPREKLEALSIPPSLRELICSCCEKDPEKRPDSMEDVVSTLESARGESTEELVNGLKTMVHYRRRDVRIFKAGRGIRVFYATAVAVLILLSYVILQDVNFQARMLVDLRKIEKVTGYSTVALRSLIPSNMELDVRSDDDLKKLLQPGMAVPLEIMLNASEDLFRTFSDGSGDTILHHAARVPIRHHEDLLVKAKQAGIVNQKNVRGDAAIHEALKVGNALGAYLLLSKGGASLIYLDGNGDTVLHLATESGSVDAVKMLLNSYQTTSRERRNHEGLTALHLAVRSSSVKILSALLSAGIQVDLRDADGLTPLMYALSLGKTHHSKKMVLRLLASGASLETRANDGRGVFDFARDSGLTKEFRRYLTIHKRRISHQQGEL